MKNSENQRNRNVLYRSADGTMVYGPVTASQNISKGKFLTGLVAGDDVIIQLIEQASAKERSKLKISRVVHAYKNTFAGLNDAEVTLLNCHNDVCSYPSWSNQSDGVANIILENGDHWCSGSLINNTSQNFRPYFLSAFHCLDGGSGDIVTSWAFRFQYKSSICSVSSITYNGSNYRAGWQDTDFLLLELQQRTFNNSIRLLGWDRSGSISSSGTAIHHPRGTQMKISFDNNALTTNSSTVTIGGTPFSANSLWVVGFDNGSVEGGSSGCPLFNTGGRTIGQLAGGPDVCPPNAIKYFGRFDRSWTGGGTNATRLSNWLDPNGTGALTTNTIRFEIAGPSLVPCTGTVTYSLPTTVGASSTVTWNVGSLQIVSGQGTNTVTVQKNPSLTANSTLISATITQSGSPTRVIQKTVNIGAPAITSITGPSSAQTGSSVTFLAQPVFPSTQGDYDWTVSPNTANVYNYRSSCDIKFNAAGSYQVGVRSTNPCTTPGSYMTTYVSVSSSYAVSTGAGKQLSVAPSGLGGATVNEQSRTIAYTLYNQATGALVASGRIAAEGGTLDFGSVADGVYLLKLEVGNDVFDTHRVMLK
jgi:hypothetical protein